MIPASLRKMSIATGCYLLFAASSNLTMMEVGDESAVNCVSNLRFGTL